MRNKYWKYFMFVLAVYTTYVAWSISFNEQNEMWLRIIGRVFGFINPIIGIEYLIEGIKIQLKSIDRKDIL